MTDKGQLKAARVIGKFCLLLPGGRCGASVEREMREPDLPGEGSLIFPRQTWEGCKGSRAGQAQFCP